MAIHTDQRFPYHSAAFGCMVESRAHLKLLEKQHGVTPITQWDLDQSVRKLRAENEKIAADAAAEDDRRDNDPALRRFREQRDRGVLTEHLTGRRREQAERALGKKP